MLIKMAHRPERVNYLNLVKRNMIQKSYIEKLVATGTIGMMRRNALSGLSNGVILISEKVQEIEFSSHNLETFEMLR